MAWDWIKRKFGLGNGATTSEVPQVRWLDPAENPWGIRVLDVRPMTLGMLSMSTDQQCAINAMSFRQDDGTGFIDVQPTESRQIPANLRFRIDKHLADGALFIPQEMEHKWAIYYHRGKIICIRSWQRQVAAIAETRIVGDFLEVTAIRGGLAPEQEAPGFAVRMFDFLLRNHALDMMYPAPLPESFQADPQRAALWCMSLFGNRAHFATIEAIQGPPPDKPLRTYSLLHIAVARGDAAQIERFLNAGVPVDVKDRDGLTPLHWALAQDDLAILGQLLQAGSSVDARSAEGATPLMNAAQGRSLAKVRYLLDHGADPNAADGRGYTTLHRAAEMGELEMVRLLLDRGAAAHPQAQGQTPRSLAAIRGQQAIVELLDTR
jgi:ankyrin repeat protein